MEKNELRMRCIECATKLELNKLTNPEYSSTKHAVIRTIKAADDLLDYVSTGNLKEKK